MALTMIEKILAQHSDLQQIHPGDIVDVIIDARVARDFGGANVVNNLERNHLSIDDPSKTYFTFDCNPGGSDQKYAANQQRCRLFARKNNIRVFDINWGIGTHLAIETKMVTPGGTFVSTDSHANIMGAIGAFGQGMGDQDIAAAWSRGKVWFKTPASVKLELVGRPAPGITAKDIVLSLLQKFGSNSLLGYAVEICGDYADEMSLTDRITISSMGTEMGAIALLFVPNKEILQYYGMKEKICADLDAHYDHQYSFDLSDCRTFLSKPGSPDDVIHVSQLQGIKIDSAFIGSCTNGSYEDMKAAAKVLEGKKVAPGVVLKIVPATNAVWDRCLRDGILEIFKKAGALVGNPGCAGCAAGQIGQNGPHEITVSTGNRNFPGKQGKGEVYLASPVTAAASAVAGCISSMDQIPDKPCTFAQSTASIVIEQKTSKSKVKPSLSTKGRIWVINKDNIDTDMIYHNRYLAIVDIQEMARYTFDNLEGWQDFAQHAKPGDIIFTGKNFGCGSSRQQAVDCFKALGIGAIVAESFGAIYERNAINAAFPIFTTGTTIGQLPFQNGDVVELDFSTGRITREKDSLIFQINPFFSVQKEIYERGGLL